MGAVLEAVKQVFLAYFKAELIRSKGLMLGILSLSVWLTLFITPLLLFKPPGMSAGRLSSLALMAVIIFIAYSVATWDWAWEIRWLMMQGVLEYVLASGRSIFTLYAGIMPVSLLWYCIAVVASGLILSAFLGPPTLILISPHALAIGLCSMVVVLLAYALLLGGTTISLGSAGPIVEFIGFILPVATGGLVPLSNMPRALQVFALVTPFSYPAELLRYAFRISTPVIPVHECEVVAAAYSAVFFALTYAFFKHQLRKLLKEGVKTVAAW